MGFIFDNLTLNNLDPKNYCDITGHNLNLKSVKYSMRDLGFLIENGSICLRSLLYSQILTGEFCSKYMRNTYASGDSDLDITHTEILRLQKHLVKTDLENS